MNVELLWWEGCPSTERALAEVREALADARGRRRRDPQREIETDDEAQAARLRRLADDPDRRRGLRPAADDEPIGLSCRVYRRPRRPGHARPRSRRFARGARARGAAREMNAMTIAIGEHGTRVRAPRHRRRDVDGARLRRRLLRPWSCSPATTARTRWPGTTGSPTPRATTPSAACASWRSTPTTPSATRATPPRR